MARDPAPLAHDDTGRGIPVLFLHGFPHDRGLWQPAVELLRDRARCITPDLPGFGASPLPASQPTLDSVADQLAELFDRLRVERAVITGLSMGGYLALAFWRRHADRVKALCLCDTRATADPAEARAKRDVMIALAQAQGSVAVAEQLLPGSLGKCTLDRLPERVAAARAMLERQSVEGIVAGLRLLRDRPDQTPTLATITVPTLVLVGAEDTLTPPDEVERMAAQIPGAIVTRMPITGHLMPFEQPAAFAAGVGTFLGQLGA